MARKNRVEVSPYERQRWLDELDKGKGVTAIANAAGRDIRVVKRHIGIAAQEREVAQARTEFLRGRLELHQEDLLGEVRRLQEVARGSGPSSLIELNSKDKRPLRLYCALLKHWVRLDISSRWESFCRAVDDYLDVREQFRGQLVSGEAGLLAEIPAGTKTYPWHGKIGEMIEAEIWHGNSRRRTYSPPQPTTGSAGEQLYQISYGEFSLLTSSVDYSVIEPVRLAHAQLVEYGTQLATMFGGPIGKLRELAPGVTYELDTLLLKRMVPGRCELCP